MNCKYQDRDKQRCFHKKLKGYHHKVLCRSDIAFFVRNYKETYATISFFLLCCFPESTLYGWSRSVNVFDCRPLYRNTRSQTREEVVQEEEKNKGKEYALRLSGLAQKAERERVKWLPLPPKAWSCKLRTRVPPIIVY